MRFCLSLPLLMLAMPVLAQTAPSEAAKKFNLDPSVLQADDGAANPSAPAEGPPETIADEEAVAAEAPATPATTTTTITGATGTLSLDTPIAALLADAHGKSVIDRDLPGLSTDENLPKFSRLSLRQFQPQTGGQLTDAMLAKVAADLAGPPARAKPVDRRRNER